MRELNDLYCSPNIIRMVKSRRMRWMGHVAQIGDRSVAYRVLVGDLRDRDHLEDLDIDGRIILKWILKV
jgi:hypothetical protein